MFSGRPKRQEVVLSDLLLSVRDQGYSDREIAEELNTGRSGPKPKDREVLRLVARHDIAAFLSSLPPATNYAIAKAVAAGARQSARVSTNRRVLRTLAKERNGNLLRQIALHRGQLTPEKRAEAAALILAHLAESAAPGSAGKRIRLQRSLVTMACGGIAAILAEVDFWDGVKTTLE